MKIETFVASVAFAALTGLAACSSPRPALMTETEPARPAARALAAEPAMPTPAAIPSTGAPAWKDAARDAVRRALPFVEQEGIDWMAGRVPMQEGQGCVSCHHVGYTLWSHAEARRAGIVPASDAIDELAATAVAFLGQPSTPRAMSVAQVLLAEPEGAEALADPLLALQSGDGRWVAVGQFPSQRRPVEESDAVATMATLLGLTAARSGAESHDEAMTAARGQALVWLEDRRAGASSEWLATQLALTSALGSSHRTADLARRLVDRQRADGGWGFLPDDASDAFSTGQALWALATLDPRSTPGVAVAVERGARYLLAAQAADGSWSTPSAAISEEPSAAKDAIYRFWGSAWASIGLARAVAG